MTFHEGELEVQRRAGVRESADEVGGIIADSVSDPAREFLERQQMAVLGTVDSNGRVWASVVTGEVGFIAVPSPRTVKIASLPESDDPLTGNLASVSHAALLAVDFTGLRRLRVNGQGIIQDGVIYIRTSQVYGNCRRYIQAREITGLRDAASRVGRASNRSRDLSKAQGDLISHIDTFFLATDHARQGPDISHKGGNPGFVRVNDARNLSYPDYNGNSMFNSLGNIVVDPRAGLLFIDFATGRTMQLTGKASIDWTVQRAQTFAGAERVVDFAIDEVIDRDNGFPLRAEFGRPSRFNP